MKLIADTHIHSMACSHAYSTVLENIAAAKAAGLKFMAITERGPTIPDAPHIWNIRSNREVPTFFDGLIILHGAEVNIVDSQGNLDIEEKTLASLDWVIASMHKPCCGDLSYEEATNAWLQVAQNPHVDVIGHSGDQRYAFDYEKVIPVFKEYGKIVEINNSSVLSRPGAKENCKTIAALCKKYGVPVVVNTDSHFAPNIGRFDQAIPILEAVDFPEELVLNAGYSRFLAVVQSKTPDEELKAYPGEK